MVCGMTYQGDCGSVGIAVPLQREKFNQQKDKSYEANV